MKHTIKIQGRGIGKIKEAAEMAIKLLNENKKNNKLFIVAEKKNHIGYIQFFEKRKMKIEIIEQTENYLVIKCER